MRLQANQHTEDRTVDRSESVRSSEEAASQITSLFGGVTGMLALILGMCSVLHGAAGLFILTLNSLIAASQPNVAADGLLRLKEGLTGVGISLALIGVLCGRRHFARPKK